MSIEKLIEFQITSRFQKDIQHLAENPLQFLWNCTLPFFHNRRNKEWTPIEDDLLKTIIQRIKGEPNCTLLSLCFPGRSGQAIYHHLQKLRSQGEIEAEFNSRNLPFDPNIRRYFLKESEKALAKEIVKISKKGIQIDKQLIRHTAMKHHQTSWIVAERATYQYFHENNIQIYEDNLNETYTQEFIAFSKSIQNRFDQDISQNDGEIAFQIIDEYNLPKPKFSNTWISSFLKRNKLSWRQAHLFFLLLYKYFSIVHLFFYYYINGLLHDHKRAYEFSL